MVSAGGVLREDLEGDDAVTRKRIYTYGGKPAQRNFTVADHGRAQGPHVKLCQTCPATEEEAAACEAVGIDVLNTSDADLLGGAEPARRKPSPSPTCR